MKLIDLYLSCVRISHFTPIHICTAFTDDIESVEEIMTVKQLDMTYSQWQLFAGKVDVVFFDVTKVEGIDTVFVVTRQVFGDETIKFFQNLRQNEKV